MSTTQGGGSATIPAYDSLIFPLLSVLGQHDSPVTAQKVRDEVAAMVGLDALARAVLLPSGKQGVFDNRVGWAHDRLKRALLSRSVRRGHWQLTDAGRGLLKSHPAGLPQSVLEEIANPAVDSKVPGSGKDPTQPSAAGRATVSPAPVTSSPQERLEEALQEIHEQLAQELLEAVREVSPAFFERLVLRVLHKMGYGVHTDDLKPVGQSGDGGIDGIIHLDPLGLQKVYVQAKRWKDGNTVGRPEIQSFYGALAERRANYGVFITASSFTASATEAARKLSDTIVLVDGAVLVKLMIAHNVGVSTEQTFEVKKLDSDFFADE